MKRIRWFLIVLMSILTTACTNAKDVGNEGETKEIQERILSQDEAYVQSFTCGYVSAWNPYRYYMVLLENEEQLAYCKENDKVRIKKDPPEPDGTSEEVAASLAEVWAMLEEDYPLDQYTYVFYYDEVSQGGYYYHADKLILGDDFLYFGMDEKSHGLDPNVDSAPEVMGGFCHLGAVKKSVLEGIELRNVITFEVEQKEEKRTAVTDEEYEAISQFIEYFKNPGIYFFDENDYGTVVWFSTKKLLMENSDLVTYRDASEYYWINVNDLENYISQYFENAEEVIPSIPTKQTNTGQILRAGEKVVFYDNWYPDLSEMKIALVEKDDTYYYAKCYYPTYAPRPNAGGEDASGVNLSPREFVIRYTEEDGYRLCAVRPTTIDSTLMK